MEKSVQLPLGLTPPHRNQYLFSDHYLNSLLPLDPRWQAALPESKALQAWLRELYAREKNQLAKYNEAQLEQHWFKPILSQLGHIFEGQASVPGLEHDIKHPDYVFFADEADRRAAAGTQRTDEYAAHALAVGEVKAWDVPLGKKQKEGGPKFEAQNPSWQIDYYLRATGLTRGILSNGRLWRLVHKDSSQRLAIYYEIDLVDLLGRDDAVALCYFTLFFRQAAFRPDAQGRMFLDDVLKESNAYAVALEEDLRENVYRALGKFIQGFLDLPANRLGANDLRTIYDNSLYLLYRLLFILYGESRGLLPLLNDQYRANYSLTRLKDEIAESQVKPAPMTTNYWGQLQNLFHIINGDDASLNRYLGVPRYNGGLFNPQLHPFLEQKAVGDRALVEAIDLLSRRGDEFVDYRTLGVRQLGSIYEGLLEYQPRYASEPMVAARDGKGEHWMEAGKVAKGAKEVERREAGEVYLETDRGERKATGSYYTPEYIVKYIVENTLTPLLNEAKGRVQGAGHLLADEILSLKVLDPAMGSGHFLVDATEVLALALATDPYLQSDGTAEEDLVYWKRRVVERCIYGVDKNPLAVELAKLSLWLATVAADQPLSFLDLHLKHGDSLIGARVADLGTAPPVLLTKKQRAHQEAGQANLFEYRLSQHLPTVMGKILEITDAESDSYERVQAKEAANDAVHGLKAPFEAVANLWVSAYFGNKFTQAEYGEALDAMTEPGKLAAMPGVHRAQTMASERDFFHWELAFPEVFYDRDGQPLRARAGFDAVVGNPPYIPNEQMEDAEREYIPKKFPVSSGKYDLSVVFLTRGAELLSGSRRLGMIVPVTWQTGNNYLQFRELNFVERKFGPLIVVNLPFDVFPDAYIDTCIGIFAKPAPNTFSVFAYPKREHIEQIAVPPSSLDTISCEQLSNEPQHRVFMSSKHYEFLARFSESTYITVGDITDSCQGPVETFFEYSDSPKRQGYLPYATCNVYRYEIDFVERKFILFGKDNPLSKFYTNPRILVRRIVSRSNRLMATAAEEPFVVKKDLNPFILTVPTYSLLFLLANINSALHSHLYIEGSTIAEKDDFRQTTLAALQSLPIRHIPFTTPPKERTRHFEKAKATYERGIRRSDDSGVLELVAQHLEHEPEQADVVHDLLAHLAAQMIELNKQKQSLVKIFWLDLEGVTEAATFKALRDKGKQESSLWRSSEAFHPSVSADSHSTRSLEESLAWSEEAFKEFVKALASKVKNLSDLVGVYRRHSASYRDLVTRLTFTDRLIDQIVYKLYGLTQEEIVIVEGQRRV